MRLSRAALRVAGFVVERRGRPALDVCASEGNAAAAPEVAEPVSPLRTSVATLLTRHILHDGETVLLILKPSLWFILLKSLWLIGIVLFLMIGAQLWDEKAARAALETGIFLITARIMWSVLQWMGRLYVLTDYRVVRIAGVFNLDIFDCPLRKVGMTRVTRTFRERLFRLGSIEITCADDRLGVPAVWQTVRRPDDVHQTLQQTIARAKQG